jgi:hypothetical protein
MPMQYISYADVEAMFRLSEGTGGHPETGRGEGHAGSRHVSITNAGLGDRVIDHKRGWLAAYTAFLSFRDQIGAGYEVLNAPSTDQIITDFQFNAPAGKDLQLTRVPVLTSMRMRYGMGGGGSGIFPCSVFTMFLRKDMNRPHRLHIISFFGEMGG